MKVLTTEDLTGETLESLCERVGFDRLKLCDVQRTLNFDRGFCAHAVRNVCA